VVRLSMVRNGLSRHRTLLSLGAVVLVVGVASLIATGALHGAPPTPTATPAPRSLDLSGTWTGQYTGQINGMFTVTWSQTADALEGTITLSSPPDTRHVIGNVTGSTILFVAVGLVTYKGAVSGSTMSGSFTTASGKTGSWTATIFP
jgi:hypothetical protein